MAAVLMTPLASSTCTSDPDEMLDLLPPATPFKMGNFTKVNSLKRPGFGDPVSRLARDQNEPIEVATAVLSIDSTNIPKIAPTIGFGLSMKNCSKNTALETPSAPLLYRALSKLQSTNPKWSSPEESVGKYCGIHEDKIQKYKCWEMKGPAEEAFEILGPKIMSALNARSVLNPSSQVVVWSAFMIGKEPRKAIPYIMFMCTQVGSRKKAMDAVKKSGLLKEYPGFRVGHWKHPPHTGDHYTLGSYYKLSFTAATRATISGQISRKKNLSVLKLCVESTSGEIRTSTVGGSVDYEGWTFFVSVSHIFADGTGSELDDSGSDEHEDRGGLAGDDLDDFVFEGFNDDDSDINYEGSDFDDNGSATSSSGRSKYESVHGEHGILSSQSTGLKDSSLHFPSAPSDTSQNYNDLGEGQRPESSQDMMSSLREPEQYWHRS